MRAERRTWGEVRKGSIIRAKDGVVWKVTHDGYGKVGLITRDGEKKLLDRPAPTAAVDIMYLTQPELEEMLTEQLGAEVMAVQRPGDHIYICPPWEGRRIEEMKDHLFLMHGISAKSANDPGVSAGMNTKAQLTRVHEIAHNEPNDRWRPHLHSDTIDHWEAIS